MTITAAEATKAFLDALAVGESDPVATREGISPYFILYGGGSFEKLPHTTLGFPVWPGRDDSHAAGRYQFEPATWIEQATKLKLHDFGPASQDTAAWDLAATVYHHRLGRVLVDDLLAGNFGHVAGALQSTWTSLSGATFPERYRAALAAPVDFGPAPSVA